jgi:hypothetical protein
MNLPIHPATGLLVLVVAAAPGDLTAQQPTPPGPDAPAAATADPQQTAAAPADTADAQPLTPEQLQSLVAPIALYPDALLAQVLVASTYPLEIVQLHQWLARHPGLEGSPGRRASSRWHRCRTP